MIHFSHKRKSGCTLRLESAVTIKHLSHRLLAAVFLFIASCTPTQIIQPPRFNYNHLLDNFYKSNPGDHLSIVSSNSDNIDPFVYKDRYLLYTSNPEGSQDIWLRDLESTVHIPLIKHPSRQHSAILIQSGTELIYVSEDRDSSGDLYYSELSETPERLIHHSLEGAHTTNFWYDSKNLSEEIEKLAKNLPEHCRGTASENNPVYSDSRSTLYFSSDRCTPEVPHIWSVGFKDGKIIGNLQKISVSPASQPDLSPDESTLIAIGQIKNAPAILRIATNSQDHSTLLQFDQNERVLFPRFDREGASIVFTLIHEDTNQNQSLDYNDGGSLYRIPLDFPKRSSMQLLLENNRAIYGLASSKMLGGTIFYAASSGQSINIFFMSSSGIIPVRGSIEDQVQWIERYKHLDQKRYFLAIDSVTGSFAEDPSYPIYLPVLLNKKREYWKQKGSSRELRRLEARIQSLVQTDPYAEVYFQSLQEPPATTIRKITSLLDDPQRLARKYPGEKTRLQVTARLLETRADLYLKIRRTEQALHDLYSTIRQYNDYHRIQEVRFKAGKMDLEQNKRISPLLDTIAEDPNTSYAHKQKVIHSILTIHEALSKAETQKFIQQELSKKHPPLVTGAVLILKATTEFQQGQYDASLSTIDQALQGAPEDSGIFIRGNQLKAEIYLLQNKSRLAYQSRLLYGGSYRPETGIKITAEEYREIIEESERYINDYLQAARSLYDLLQENLESGTLQNLKQTVAIEEQKITLDAFQRDTLRAFCSSSSRSRLLLARTGNPEHFKRYSEICIENSAYIERKTHSGIRIDGVQKAADLLYLSSYVNANLLNIMFLHIKKTDQFPELYRSRSVLYHRLKTDIAIERNKRQTQWSKTKTTLIDPEELQSLFVENDPFDDTALNEIIHGYQYSAPEARNFGDLSLLYGYAYALIQKSVEREQFYKDLMEEGVSFSREALLEKKESLLKSFKQAEYQLQYILQVQPDYTDARILLGWMYQYIDEQRETILPIQAGLLEKGFDSIVGTRTVPPLDRAYYSDIYSAYFPNQLYETNIILYNSALKGESFAKLSYSEKFHLHLNIANNHFKLLNFRHSASHFEKAIAIQENTGKTYIDDYRTEALLYFNTGRSLFYEGRSSEASQYMEKAFQIYYDQEMIPLEQKFSSNVFLKNQSRKNFLEKISSPISFTGNSNPFSEVEKQYTATRNKLALISALIGLAHWDSGNYEKAIESYKTSDLLFSTEKNPDSSIQKENLYNFLSLAQQYRKEYGESTDLAKKAQQIAAEKGLDHFQRRYQPETTGGRLLGCVLNFGEDFSIIGEGRNPYGFSPLRNYELSLGIQLENKIRQGDYRSALKLIEQRQAVFLDEDSERISGKTGLVTSLNQKAFVYYNRAYYLQASKLFFKAADHARQSNLLELYRSNTINYYQSIFSYLEYESEDYEHSAKQLDQAKNHLERFRDEYRIHAKQIYIDNRKTENPSFEYSPPRDDSALERIINQDLLDLIQIQGDIAFYEGFLNSHHPEKGSDVPKTVALYQSAIDSYNQTLSSLDPGNPLDRIRRIRVRYNRSKAFIESFQYLQAHEDLEELARQTGQYKMLHENFRVHSTLADLEQRIIDSKISFHGSVDPVAHLESAMDLLKETELIPGLSVEEVGLFANQYASEFLKKKNYQKANFVLELYRAKLLFRYLIQYPLEMETKQETNLFEEYRNLIKKKESLLSRRTFDLLQLKSPDSVNREILQTNQLIQSTKQALLKLKPELSLFFLKHHPGVQIRPGSHPDRTLWVRFLESNRTLVGFAKDSEGRWFQSNFEPFHGPNKPQIYSLILEQIRDQLANRQIQNIVIIPDPNFQFQLSNEALRSIFPESKSITYDTTTERFAYGYLDNPINSRISDGFNLFNTLTSQELRPNPQRGDLLLVSLPEQTLQTGEESFDHQYEIRKWAGKKSTFSGVLWKQDAKTRFQDLIAPYEAFRASGVATMYLVNQRVSINEALAAFHSSSGRSPHSKGDSPILGLDGFARQNNQEVLFKHYNKTIQLAKIAQSSGKLDLALTLYSLSQSISHHLNEIPRDHFMISIMEKEMISLALKNQQSDLNSLTHTLKELSDFESSQNPEESEKLVFQFVHSISSELVKQQLYEKNKTWLDRAKTRITEKQLQQIESRNAYLILLGSNSPVAKGRPDQNPIRLFDQNLDLLTQTRNPEWMIDHMLAHGLYHLASRFMHSYNDRNEGIRKIDGLYLQLTKLMEQLEKNTPLDPEIYKKAENIFSLLESRIRMRESKNSSELETLAMQKKPLLEALRKAIHKEPFDVPQLKRLERTSGWSENHSLYLRALESISYRLNIENIILDPEKTSASNIQIILEEHIRPLSLHKRAVLSLHTAKALIENEDFPTSYHFYKNYISDTGTVIQSPEIVNLFLELTAYYDLAGIIQLDRDTKQFEIVQQHSPLQKLPVSFQAPDIQEYIKFIYNTAQRRTGSLEMVEKNADLYHKYVLSLKYRMIHSENWEMSLTLQGLQEELELFLFRIKHQDHKNAEWELQPYLNPLATIQKRLPENQRFIALIETGDVAVRLSAGRNDLTIDSLPVDGKRLRGNLYTFHRISSNRKTNPAAAEFLNPKQEFEFLVSTYHNLKDPNAPISYLYLPGVHFTAPINPDRHSSFYRIASLKHFIQRNHHVPDFTIDSDDPIEWIGPAARNTEAFSPLKMEYVSLEHKGNGKNLPAYITGVRNSQSVLIHNIAFAREKLQTGGDHSASFLAFELGHPVVATDTGRILLLRDLWARESRGTAILMLGSPDHLIHPHFVKHFYDRNLPEGTISRRFLHGSLSIASLRAHPHETYGYALLTPGLIVD